MKDSNAKEVVIKRMFNVLKGQGMYIKDNNDLSTQEKVEQMDVILDLMKFLKDYDENVQVLNKHLQNKKWQSKSIKDR